MTAQEMIKMNDMPKPMSESQEKIDHQIQQYIKKGDLDRQQEKKLNLDDS